MLFHRPFFVFILGFLLVGVAQAHAEPRLGVYRYGDAGTNTTRGIAPYANWLGGDVSLGEDFTDYTQGWANAQGPSWAFTSWQPWLQAKPGRNVIQSYPLLPSFDGSRTLPDGSTVSWAECAAGKYNAFYANYARSLMNYGLDAAYIRLAWEFDGNWYGWAVRDGEEADFVACWRQAVSAIRAAAPGNQYKFVWNVDTFYQTDRGGINWLAKTYPGNDVVDVIGIELYDVTWDTNAYPYPAGCDATCKQSRQDYAWNNRLFPALSSLLDFTRAHKKQFGFGEWGVTDRKDGATQRGGLDNPSFVQRMHDLIMDPANNVAFHIYFDVDVGDGGHRLANMEGLTVFTESAALFKKLFASHTGSTPLGGSSGISMIPVQVSGKSDFNFQTPSATAHTRDWGLIDALGGYFEFNLFTAQAGSYSLVLLAKTTESGGIADVIVNGVKVTTAQIPNTGDWNTTGAAPAVTINLPSGRSIIRFANTNAPGYALAGASLSPIQLHSAAPVGSYDGIFTSFVAANSGLCATVSAGSMLTGAGLVQAVCNGAPEQMFKLHKNAVGYSLQPVHSGLCLDFGSAAGGAAQVAQVDCSANSLSQSWEVAGNGDGSFSLISSQGGNCLDVNSQSTSTGAVLGTWGCKNDPGAYGLNQRFLAQGLAPVLLNAALDPAAVDGKVTSFTNVNSGLCVDATAGGLVQRPCTGVTPQSFKFSAVSGGGYQIHPAGAPANCLQYGNTVTAGAQVVTKSCSASPATQLWMVKRNADNTLSIGSSDGKGCLDIQGASLASGVAVLTWSCKNDAGKFGANQRFKSSL